MNEQDSAAAVHGAACAGGEAVATADAPWEAPRAPRPFGGGGGVYAGHRDYMVQKVAKLQEQGREAMAELQAAAPAPPPQFFADMVFFFNGFTTPPHDEARARASPTLPPPGCALAPAC